MSEMAKILLSEAGIVDAARLPREARITLVAKILGIDPSVAFNKLRRVTPKEHPMLEQERRERAKADAQKVDADRHT